MQNVKPNAHQLAADDVLSVLMHNGESYRVAMFEAYLNPSHMPTQGHAALLLAIITLRGDTPEGALPHPALLALCEKHVTAQWLIDCHVAYDRIIQSTFNSNLELLLRHGQANSVRRDLANGAARINPDNFDEVVNETLTMLATSGKTHRIENEYARQHGQEFSDLMQGAPEMGLRTGITWLDDDMFAPFYPSRVMLVAGAYKTGKTRFANNLVLGCLMCEPTARVAVYNREVPRNAAIAQFVSMLACQWLFKRDLLNTYLQDNMVMGNLSAEKLMKARNLYKTWNTYQVQAIDYAIKTYIGFGERLVIYDSTRQNGGLSDLASLERNFKRNLALQNADLHMVDYAQLFTADGSSEVERSDKRAVTFQTMAIQENKTLLVLAQRNEESIKGGESYSAGIRGGGMYSAAAENVLLTSYKVADRNDTEHFPVEMKYAKWGETGRTELRVHPPSGLILDASWVSA